MAGLALPKDHPIYSEGPSIRLSSLSQKQEGSPPGPVEQKLKSLGLPLTRENWMNLAYPDSSCNVGFKPL
jgi:hypothetical protein